MAIKSPDIQSSTALQGNLPPAVAAQGNDFVLQYDAFDPVERESLVHGRLCLANAHMGRVSQ